MKTKAEIIAELTKKRNEAQKILEQANDELLEASKVKKIDSIESFIPTHIFNTNDLSWEPINREKDDLLYELGTRSDRFYDMDILTDNIVIAIRRETDRNYNKICNLYKGTLKYY